MELILNFCTQFVFASFLARKFENAKMTHILATKLTWRPSLLAFSMGEVWLQTSSISAFPGYTA